MPHPILRALMPAPADRPRVALALALAVAGGTAGAWLGMPLPWMLGPMLVCGAASFAGLPVSGPNTIRPIVIPVIGVMLGAGFTPEILAQINDWAVTFALLAPFLAVAGTASWLWFHRVGGYDGRTAFFSAAPGGLAEMVVLGEAAGADARRIALSHAVRVFLVVTLVAFGFALIEGTTTAGFDGAYTTFREVGLWDAAVLLACAVVGGPLAKRLGLPAHGLFGPMLLSAALHIGGIVTAAPPTVLVGIAQVVMGTVLGCRFAGATLRETGRDMGLAAGATVILLTVTLAFAGAVAVLSAAPWSQAVLAYSPGGLTEMSLLALAKKQDVAYVATAHITRIAIILIAIQPVFRAMGNRWPPVAKPGTDDGPPRDPPG